MISKCMVESWTFVPRNEKSVDKYESLLKKLFSLVSNNDGESKAFRVEGNFYLEGATIGHEHAEDGSGIKTSNVVAVAKNGNILYAKTTSGSIYGFDFKAGSDLSLMGLEELQKSGKIELAYPRI